jgi:LacI family transcriptional regulator
MKELNIEVDGSYIQHADFTREDASAKTSFLLSLKSKPDAIIAFSDQMAISAILAMRKAGYSIPGDIAIMGFNNEPGDLLMEPTLTSIDQPAFEMGKKAAEILLARINGNDERKVEVLHSKLIERNSTNKL